MPEKKLIGKVTHYFDKIGVAVVEASAPIKAGDKIRFEGGGNSFEQTVSSMQVEHEEVKEAKKGASVGMKVDQPVKEGYKVYEA